MSSSLRIWPAVCSPRCSLAVPVPTWRRMVRAGPAAAPAAVPAPGHYGYGRAPTPQEVAGWAISVRPDGQGLPPGKGT